MRPAWLLGPLSAVFTLLAAIALSRGGGGASDSAAVLSIPPLSRRDVQPAPLVAVADLHGDWPNALLSLQLTGAVDAGGHWVGGTSHLVQTGDVVDRGEHSVRLLQHLWQLREEAEAAGGRVTLLVGNHEVWALMGVNNYASAKELRTLGGGSVTEGHAQWNELFHPRTGDVGRVIATTHDVAVVAGDGECRTLFVHAGLLPAFLLHGASHSLEHLTARFRQGVSAHPGAAVRDRALFGSKGPFWVRSLALGPEQEACGDVATVLAAVNATRMVVGHTVQEGGASVRCGGALVLLDAGICSAYAGRPTAWQCTASGAVIQELHGQRHLMTPP
jgi:hypothetical protein